MDEVGIVKQAVVQQREREPPAPWLALSEPQWPTKSMASVAGPVSFAEPNSV